MTMEKIREIVAYKNHFEDFLKAIILMKEYYESKK